MWHIICNKWIVFSQLSSNNALTYLLSHWIIVVNQLFSWLLSIKEEHDVRGEHWEEWRTVNSSFPNNKQAIEDMSYHNQHLPFQGVIAKNSHLSHYLLPPKMSWNCWKFNWWRKKRICTFLSQTLILTLIERWGGH